MINKILKFLGFKTGNKVQPSRLPPPPPMRPKVKLEDEKPYVPQIQKKMTPPSKATMRDKEGRFVSRPPVVHHTNTVYQNDDGFATSMLIGALTHDPLLGMVGGGNIAGAMLGAAMTDDNERYDTVPHSDPVHHNDIPVCEAPDPVYENKSYDLDPSPSYDSGSSYDSDGSYDSSSSGGDF